LGIDGQRQSRQRRPDIDRRRAVRSPLITRAKELPSRPAAPQSAARAASALSSQIHGELVARQYAIRRARCSAACRERCLCPRWRGQCLRYAGTATSSELTTRRRPT
jgi:hypothetical protein